MSGLSGSKTIIWDSLRLPSRLTRPKRCAKDEAGASSVTSEEKSKSIPTSRVCVATTTSIVESPLHVNRLGWSSRSFFISNGRIRPTISLTLRFSFFSLSATLTAVPTWLTMHPTVLLCPALLGSSFLQRPSTSSTALLMTAVFSALPFHLSRGIRVSRLIEFIRRKSSAS